MPYYGPSHAEIREAEIAVNRREFGIAATDEDLNREVACQALTCLEELGEIGSLPKHVRQWWAQYKKDEATRLRQEASALKKQQARQEALAKLTARERRILGL